jgi:hypothetical protein
MRVEQTKTERPSFDAAVENGGWCAASPTALYGCLAELRSNGFASEHLILIRFGLLLLHRQV